MKHFKGPLHNNISAPPEHQAWTAPEAPTSKAADGGVAAEARLSRSIGKAWSSGMAKMKEEGPSLLSVS